MFTTTLPERFFPAHTVEWTTGDPTFDVRVIGFDGNLMLERVNVNFYDLEDEFLDKEETDGLPSWELALFEYLAHDIPLENIVSVYQPF